MESKEEALEAERMRLEAVRPSLLFCIFSYKNVYKISFSKVRQSERERREKYRRQEEEREQVGDGLTKTSKLRVLISITQSWRGTQIRNVMIILYNIIV